jgi:hypothetical protein
LCDKCDEMDGRIRRCLQLARAMTDSRALESIARLIADMESRKQTLHPKPQVGRLSWRLFRSVEQVRCFGAGYRPLSILACRFLKCGPAPF